MNFGLAPVRLDLQPTCTRPSQVIGSEKFGVMSNMSGKFDGAAKGSVGSGDVSTASPQDVAMSSVRCMEKALRPVLYRQTLAALAGAGVLLLAVNVFMAHVATLGVTAAVTSLAIYATVGAVVVSRILAFHPHPAFGWPNAVTLTRLMLAALVAGYTAEISQWVLQPSDSLAWTFALVAGLAVTLDGLDGFLARTVGPRSSFGARFDMESDALLILILSVLAAVLGKVGLWVLITGLLRYLFLASALVWPWLDNPLPASQRRRAVCVLQGAALCMLVAPPVTGHIALALAATAVAANVISFAVDVAWLYCHRPGVAADDGL